MDARATYTKGKDDRAKDAAAHEARSRSIGFARLLVALGAITLIGAIVWAPLPSEAWAGVIALVVVFAALVVWHSRVIQRKDGALAGQRFHERGLARLDGKWTAGAQTGERFRTADHPFSDDLDIFGRASLFQLTDATETRFGEDRLAGLLAGTDLTRFPDGVRERQAAVRDLAGRVAFREKISALGALLGAEKPDPRPFLAWAEGSMPFPHNAAMVWAARMLPVITVGVLVVGSMLNFTRTALIGVLVFEVLVALAFRGNVAKVAGMVSARETGLFRYGEMFRALESESFDAPLLKQLQQRLRAGGASATANMTSLSRILSFLDARNNEVFRFFIGPILLWDLNCVLSLERWRERAGASARAWFEVLGEIEAIASLAGFAFERPENAWPELTDTPTFEARGLGHPLLPADRRVDNDVALEAPGHGLIVTGSNMSGKSTLLRAMGINAVLALAGAPVCAKALRIGRMRVVTSMRVRDSLEEGVSHFYAELQKLKRVVDLARKTTDGGGGTVMFLLDEILHGTNSRERIIGARAILKELLAQGATGAVSTHDLGISDLEAELAGNSSSRVKNVHFEEQVEGEKMTFDYRLRTGIVQSSNALRLMKLVGIDVALSNP